MSNRISRLTPVLTVLLTCVLLLAANTRANAQLTADAAAASKGPDVKIHPEAMPIIKAMIDAYQKAPALTDMVTLTYQGPDKKKREHKMTVRLGAGNEAEVLQNAFQMHSFGGSLYMVDQRFKTRCLKVSNAPNPMQAAMKLNLDRRMPAHIPMRYDGSNSSLVNALSFGLLRDASVAAPRRVEEQGGAVTDVLTLNSEDGVVHVHIDAKTRLLRSVRGEIRPKGAPADYVLNLSVAMAPKITESLDPPVTFDPGDRTVVSTMQELMRREPAGGQGADVGAVAPDFTLTTLGGETVKLSDLRGSVVVLDFWATWCGPCKRGLPLFQEFANWAQQSGHPIKVYAVNVMERGSKADKESKVRGFWTKSEYTVPCLFDHEDTVKKAYGVNSIPRTFIIGPDGRIARVHRGFSSDMVRKLQNEVGEVLQSAK